MSETMQEEPLEVARDSSLANLEQRAAVLEKEFDRMMQTAQDLLRATERYADKQDTENKCWKLLDALIEAGKSSRDILDHVRVFFQFILSQMKLMGADILDEKMLWHLHDNEDLKSTFFLAVNHFGFSADDLPHLKVLLAVIYKLQTDNEKEVPLEQDNVVIPDEKLDLYENIELKDKENYRKIISSFVENSFKENLNAMSYCLSPKNESTTLEDENPMDDVEDLNKEISDTDNLAADITTVTNPKKSFDVSFDTEHNTIRTKAKPECDSKQALDKKQFRNTLQTWGVGEDMRKTLQKVMYTFFWMLNVGRKEKTLTIIPKHKL